MVLRLVLRLILRHIYSRAVFACAILPRLPGLSPTGALAFVVVGRRSQFCSGRAVAGAQGHLKKNPLTDRLIYYTSAQCIGESGGPAGLSV